MGCWGKRLNGSIGPSRVSPLLQAHVGFGRISRSGEGAGLGKEGLEWTLKDGQQDRRASGAEGTPYLGSGQAARRVGAEGTPGGLLGGWRRSGVSC